MAKCITKILGSLFVVCIMCTVFFVSVSAIDLDNEWHEPRQIGFNLSSIGYGSFESAAEGIPVPNVVNQPCILNDVNDLKDEYVGSYYITIPIVGDTWQCDASKGLEFRFVVSSEDAYFQEVYGCRVYNDALPLNSGTYYKLSGGKWSQYQTRFLGITDEEMVIQAYINGSSDELSYEATYELVMQTQPLMYDCGVMYNIIIAKDQLPQSTKSVTFFIGTRSSVAQRRMSVNSVAVRNFNIEDELSVQKSILASIQELASRQGLNSDQIAEAVVSAFEQMKQEEQNAGDAAVSELDSTVSDIMAELKLDGIRESIENINTLFDFESQGEAFIVNIPSVNIKLAGKSFTAFPGITWNISGAVYEMFENAKQAYPEFEKLILLCGIVLTICISLGCVKIIIGMFITAFTPEKTLTINNYNENHYTFDEKGNGGGGSV